MQDLRDHFASKAFVLVTGQKKSIFASAMSGGDWRRLAAIAADGGKSAGGR